MSFGETSSCIILQSLGLHLPMDYTCPSKLKLKPTALKSIRFSFNSNKELATGCRLHLIFIKYKHILQEKHAK